MYLSVATLSAILATLAQAAPTPQAHQARGVIEALNEAELNLLSEGDKIEVENTPKPQPQPIPVPVVQQPHPAPVQHMYGSHQARGVVEALNEAELNLLSEGDKIKVENTPKPQSHHIPVPVVQQPHPAPVQPQQPQQPQPAPVKIVGPTFNADQTQQVQQQTAVTHDD